ncbi:hypothetical protein [Mameliella alba]|uniref:Uncharacterized protein n=1 Tax=Mameliella alba TaxID=561184 RepID=A0A0B3S0X7_9RHOB|nr:hypothetical protein [Mameliella alba]KHQ50266.1 hypothetical protein OA50_05114 [Mameliella alba]
MPEWPFLQRAKGLHGPFAHIRDGLSGLIAPFLPTGASPSNVMLADFPSGTFASMDTQRTFDGLFTHSRASTATYVDDTGAIQTAAVDEARTQNYIPDGEGGWTGPLALMEPQSTNLVLNSDTLSTQGVTVTAEPHTLHFTGTGTVTLSGVATDGPLVGTGTGEDNRVSLTFTPSAGTLTLTVSGTVTNAQLETGSVPTSYIPTAGSQVTRAVDSLSIDSSVTGLTASDTALSIHMDGYMTYADIDRFNTVRFMQIGNGADPTLTLFLSTSGARTGDVNAQQVGSTFWGINGPDTSYSPGVDVPFDIAARYTDSALNIAIDGTAETEVATTEFPSPLQGHDMQIATAGVLNIKTLVIAYEDWGNAGIAEITT